MNIISHGLSFLFFIIIFINISCNEVKPNNPIAKKGVIDLRNNDFGKENYFTLDGEWEFYPNEFISNTATISSSPKYIKVPLAWNSQPKDYISYPKYSYGSYRLKILLGNKSEFPTLRLQFISSAYRIFCNGKEYQNSGLPGSSIEISIPSISIEESTIFKNEEGIIDLVLHVSNFQLSNAGILRSIQIGSNTSITNLQTRDDASHWLFTGMILIMGLYHLGIYFLRMKDLSPLYFGFYCFLSSIREFFIIERGINRIFSEIDFKYWIKFDHFFLFLSITFFAYYMKSLFPNDTSKLVIRIAALSHFIMALLLIFSPINLILYFEDFSKFSIPLLSLYYLYVLIHALINKRDSSILFLFGFSIVYYCIINDLLLSINFISSDRLLPYGITCLIFIQSYILSRRFNFALQHAETLSIQLEKMGKVKDEFMSNLSHEIRTPLSLIYAYSELLKDYTGPDEDSIKSYGMDIHREANNLSENINDLMLVTDLETKFKIKEELVEVHEMILEAIKYLENMISEKNIKIEISILKDLKIVCDKSLIIKVFIIVIKNAIVYNFTKGKIKIYSDDYLDSILLYIEDNGPGISSDDLHKIFDKFYRVDSSITYNVSGVGVGLFIAKRIIDLHLAKIDASSVLGKGTSIILQFPKIKD
jgi:two-component system, sensor histidine kinase ChiS